MDISADKFSLAKWIDHPLYFIICLAVGVGLWTLSFNDKKVNYESIQLSSFAENLAAVQSTELETINRLPAQKNYKKELPKRFKDNPVFKVFVHIENLIGEPDSAEPEK